MHPSSTEPALLTVRALDTSPRRPGLSFGSWAFAFGPFSEAPWSFERVCAFVADAGYDAVEINGFRPHPHPQDFNTPYKRSQLSKKIAGFNLAISGYAPDMTTAPPPLASTAAYLREIDACRGFCEGLGITTLRIDTICPPTSLSPDEYEERFSQLVRNFTAAAGRLEQSGVRLVWEFEPGFWLNKPSEILRLLKATEHPNLSVLFDTSHALTVAMGQRHAGKPEVLEGGAIELAEMLAPYVGHLHLIDSVGKLHNEDTSEHLPFGTGTVDFDGVMAALGDRAPSVDWWTVDFCFWAGVETDGVSAVPFVDALRARTVGES